MLGASAFAVRVGVGSKPVSVSLMRGTQVGRREAHVSAGVTNSVKIVGSNGYGFSCNIFSKYVRGFYGCDYPKHFRPKVFGGIVAVSGVAVGLARSREPATNHIDLDRFPTSFRKSI